jgi:hypothetical protein
MTTHNDLSESQGPVTHFREIANQFQDLGLEVLAFGPDLSGRRKPMNFPMRYLSCVIKKRGISQLLYEIVLFFVLFKECLQRRPDVIYSRQSYITLASPLVALILGIRLVSEINGLHVEDLQGRDASWIKKAINAACEKLAYELSHRTIGVSERICDILSERYGVDRDKFLALPAPSRQERPRIWRIRDDNGNGDYHTETRGHRERRTTESTMKNGKKKQVARKK